MTTPIGIGFVDARRLVLDGLLEGLPPGLGIVPGRTRVRAAGLVDLAGVLAATMRAGDPPRRVCVVADLSIGATLGAVTSFLGYVGGASSVDVVEVDAPGDRAVAGAIHAVGAVPFFRDDPVRLMGMRRDLGAAIGMIIEPDETTAIGGHDVPVRVIGDTCVVGGSAGVLNLIGAVALVLEGEALETAAALLAEPDAAALVLGRRTMRWRERSIAVASLRAARQRFDGIAAPSDFATLLID